jgi:hypothetical protein
MRTSTGPRFSPAAEVAGRACVLSGSHWLSARSGQKCQHLSRASSGWKICDVKITFRGANLAANRARHVATPGDAGRLFGLAERT